MTSTITIMSSKGGAGKTTVALNLAVALAERGRRTLLVDLDPQGAIGLSLAKSDTEWEGLAEVLCNRLPLGEALVQTKLANLCLLQRGRLNPVDVCNYEQSLFSTRTLDKAIGELQSKFEYILLDAPSGLGMVTRAALRASSHVLMPLQAEPLASRSLVQPLRVIEHVQQTENPQLQLLGILPTMVQLGHEASLNVMYNLWSGFGGVLETFIPRAEVFIHASEKGLPLSFLGGPLPPDARRFELLAAEIEGLVRELSGEGSEGTERRERALI